MPAQTQVATRQRFTAMQRLPRRFIASYAEIREAAVAGVSGFRTLTEMKKNTRWNYPTRFMRFRLELDEQLGEHQPYRPL